MIKSIIKVSSLAVFTLTLIIAPIQQAQALSPYAAFPEFASVGLAALGGEVSTPVAAAGVSASSAIAVGLSSLVVGTAVGGLTVSYVCASGAVDACNVRQPLTNNQLKQFPPPAAASTTTQIAAHSDNDPTYVAQCNGGADGCSAAQTANLGHTVSCRMFVSGHSCFTYYDHIYTNGTTGTTGPSTWGIPQTTIPASCPSGYSIGSGTSCNLIDARLVTSDKNVDIATNGNISSLKSDVDTMAANKKPVISADGTDVKYAGYVTGSDGQKHMLWVDVKKQNTADATADLYNMEVSYIEHNMGACATDPSCQYLGSTPQEITTQKIQIANGVVVGTATTTKTGIPLSPSDSYIDPVTNTTKTVQPAELVVSTPDTTGLSTTPTKVLDSPLQPKTQTLTLPTDYARQGEAQTAANIIRDKLAESDPQTDLVEPTLTNPFVDYFNPLRAWSYPNVQGICPFGSFTWNDHNYSFEAGCTLFNDNLGIIHGVMSVVYALAALFIVLGA